MTNVSFHLRNLLAACLLDAECEWSGEIKKVVMAHWRAKTAGLGHPIVSEDLHSHSTALLPSQSSACLLSEAPQMIVRDASGAFQ